MAIEGNKNMLDVFLEHDIERLSREVDRIKNTPEFHGAEPREIVKESLKTFTSPQNAPAGQLAGGGDDDDSGSLLPDYLKDASPELKLGVEQLIDVAIHKGIIEGAANARKRGGFFLDAFHDALADKIYPELQKRGLIR